MFLTILNESFATVRNDIDKQSNEHELVEFMVGRFKQWTGLGALLGSGKKDKSDKNKEKDKEEKEKEQIDNFQEKIEQLLDSLSKVRNEQLCFFF